MIVRRYGEFRRVDAGSGLVDDGWRRGGMWSPEGRKRRGSGTLDGAGGARQPEAAQSWAVNRR